MSRPGYIIAHRCNSTSDIDAALEKGANAIECDVRYGRVTVFASRNWFVDHDGVYAWSTKLDDWLDAARSCADKHGDAFALIIFDIKTAERVDELRDRVRAKLPDNLNVLFSTGEYSDRTALEKIDQSLKPNEGVAIDFDNDPAKVQSHFVGRGVHNFWYGNGIFVAGVGPNVRPSLVSARDLRDADGGIKKTYVWTLAKDSSIKDYFEEVKVDGVMVNESTIKDAVRIAREAGARIATRSDSAFERF